MGDKSNRIVVCNYIKGMGDMAGRITVHCREDVGDKPNKIVDHYRKDEGDVRLEFSSLLQVCQR